jgi:putative protein-disulfide isomerase
MSAILYYVHDPMCSWCWGYRPSWEQLRSHLPEGVTTRNLLGGLAPDSDQPMPPELQQKLQAVWQQIHSQLGTEFNFDFWTANQPRRSTYPACRAVIAAAIQGREEEMILAIQRGYYLRALNPSDSAILQQLAEELSLDVGQFVQDLESADTEQHLQQQINLSRQLPIAGFPSLVLQVNEAVFPITLDYRNYQQSLQDIHTKLAGQGSEQR